MDNVINYKKNLRADKLVGARAEGIQFLKMFAFLYVPRGAGSAANVTCQRQLYSINSNTVTRILFTREYHPGGDE